MVPQALCRDPPAAAGDDTGLFPAMDEAPGFRLAMSSLESARMQRAKARKNKENEAPLVSPHRLHTSR